VAGRIEVAPLYGFWHLVVVRMYFMSFLRKSANEVNTPRAITSRSILANQSSIWLSQEE